METTPETKTSHYCRNLLCEVFWSFEFTLHKRFIDDDLGRDIC